MKKTNKNSSNKTVQVFLFCFSLQSDKMFMKRLRFNFIRFQQIHCSSFKFETHSYSYQYQKQKGIKYMYDQIYKLKVHLHNVMIRFSAWSLICVLLRIGALIPFLEKQQNVRDKALLFMWRGSRRLENGNCYPWILPGSNTQPSDRRKIWRRDQSLEITVHSHGRDSGETKTKATAFKMRL